MNRTINKKAERFKNIELLRSDFEASIYIPENSGIEWYPERGKYLTRVLIWKKQAKRMTDGFIIWQLCTKTYRVNHIQSP